MARTGTATKGRRVALPPKEPVAPKVYVCGHKPLPFGEITLTEGVEVPGAASWPRLDSWVSSRRIRKIDPDESYISFEDFIWASEKEPEPKE